MEVAVIGSDRFVLGFRLAGVHKTYGVPKDGIEAKVHQVMVDKKVGIIVLLDKEFRGFPAAFRRKLVNSVSPVVIAIGKVEEVDLRERIKQAVGVDLWNK